MRRTLLLLTFLVGCDGGSEAYALLGCIPFIGPLLAPDAGPTTGTILALVAPDAAGFFDEDAGIPDDARCTPVPGCDSGPDCRSSCGAGSQCVPVTSSRAYCLRSCTDQPCLGDSVACESIGGTPYCLPRAARGEACERRSCAAADGLHCLPARAEGDVVLAYTCQKPCDPTVMGTCGAESCLPNAAGTLELQGAAAVACSLSSCGLDGGSCACASGFGCMTSSTGGVCARVQHVCGTGVASFAPVRSADGGVALPTCDGTGQSCCDPGPAQAYCAPPVDGNAPVWCAQSLSAERVGPDETALPGIRGTCLAICRDPSLGTSNACPTGQACTENPAILFHVTDPGHACTTSAQCVTSGGTCVGPLPGFGFESRCAVPYGICQQAP